MSEPIGQRLMLSTPPAYTRSYAPDAAPCAARFTAVWPDPQKRFRLTPAISIGQPAARTAARATQAPCSPVSVTQPMIASSMRVGSTPVRATMACIGTVQTNQDACNGGACEYTADCININGVREGCDRHR